MRLALACALVAMSVPLAAQDRKPLSEKQAVAAVAGQLAKLGKFCAAGGAWTEARIEFQRAFMLSASNPLRDEIVRAAAAPNTAKPGFADALAAERAKVYRECAAILAEAALAQKKAGKLDGFERLVWIAATHLPDQTPLKDAGLVCFEPYLTWVGAEDAKRLEAGDEHIDGKWVDAGAVRQLDQKHATWSSPWVISDEVSELRTTLPLRSARHVLVHVAAFRAFFLREFAGLRDLRPPKGKLPIFFTETQADMMACFENERKRLGTDKAPWTMAFYVWTPNPLNPCFVTLEPKNAVEQVKGSVDDALSFVRHELVHQFSSEYSRHAMGSSQDIPIHQWACEGIAYHLQHYDFKAGTWLPVRTRSIPVGRKVMYTPFGWLSDNRASLATVEKAVEEFLSNPAGTQPGGSAEKLHVATALAWFFMDGENARYRPFFCRLLDLVDRHTDSKTSFKDCFKGVDLKKLEEEWRQFVNQIVVE